MRQKLHTIFHVMITTFICLLFSCASSNKEVDETFTDSSILSLNDTILEKTFENDTLDNMQVALFQKRALEKLTDFINYIEIISNKSYDSELRLVARQQISQLFTDSIEKVSISIDESNKHIKPLYRFLNEIYQCTYDSIKITTNSVAEEQPQLKNEPLRYVGSVTASVKIIGYKNAKKVFISDNTHRAKIVIHKIKKRFGEDIHTIWTVSIGELQ